MDFDVSGRMAEWWTGSEKGVKSVQRGPCTFARTTAFLREALDSWDPIRFLGSKLGKCKQEIILSENQSKP